MVISPDRLEELHLARLESRLRRFEGIIGQVESQIDHDLRGGWGDIEEQILDPRDPRSVRIEFTTELDTGAERELGELEPADRELVEREIRRRYMEAGYRSLAFLDEGRVRLEHVIGPAASAAATSPPADPGAPAQGAADG